MQRKYFLTKLVSSFTLRTITIIYESDVAVAMDSNSLLQRKKKTLNRKEKSTKFCAMQIHALLFGVAELSAAARIAS